MGQQVNVCEYCETENRLGAKFCAKCGKTVKSLVVHSKSDRLTKQCEYCGIENRLEAKFCAKCGKTLKPLVVHGRPGPLTKQCEHCGTANKPGAKFCTKCGKPLKPLVIHGRYRIVGILGQGGMSTIYKAEDNNLGQRLVAVKEMRLSGLQSREELQKVLSAFEQEALLLARLSHPHLPSIYDHFSDNEHWYIVMQYINGQTLSQGLHTISGERVPVEGVLAMGIILCEVLIYLHAQTPPVIFSDLKPDNMRPPNITVVKQALQRITELYIQEQNITVDSPLWGQATSVGYKPSWETPSAGSTQPWSSETLTAYGGSSVLTSFPAWTPQPWDATIPAYAVPVPFPGQAPASAWGVSSTLEVPPPPTSATNRDMRLSLGVISALAWSPDGSHLAAANEKEVHIYAWPSEEELFLFEDEVLTPLHTWLLQDLLPSEASEPVEEPDTDWINVSTVIPERTEKHITMAWSLDSTYLAIAGEAPGSKLIILNTVTESSTIAQTNHKSPIRILSWSPDGNFMASGGDEHIALVQEVKTEQKISSMTHTGSVTAVAWSPDGTYLASASTDGMIEVWEATSGNEVCVYHGQTEYVHDILWNADGTYIISCGEDHTIQIWDAKTASKLRSLEGHTDSVQRLAFLDQGRLLASLSRNGTVCIWRTDNWTLAEKFKTNFTLRFRTSDIAFHPINALVAQPTSFKIITLYEIDIDQVYNGPSKVTGIQYTNAKVVLLGDSGVGKTGLGLVLSRQGFAATDSTHGRTVWTFATQERKLDDGRKEIRETLLWDLAGQPGYRLIHQLHLSEVSLALVVFDAHSETDPFAGISHWVRALRTAQRVKGNKGIMKMLLVLARIDRGGKRVSQDRIQELVQKLEFDAYYETSAKEGTNIATLSMAIKKTIDWEQLPKVTSTELLQFIRSFLLAEKQAGRLLSTEDDLYRAFLSTRHPWDEIEDLFAEFATGIRLLESTGLIRRLSFGNLVLLQPELLDTYASALVNAVRDEPDGLGSISEEAALAAKFSIPKSERIADPEQERLLLISMIQDLLSYEIALREQGADGPYLIFPSESTRENPKLSNPENASIVFTFEGPILNIYATLAVRLSHTGLFTKKELWKNAIIYNAKVGGICGIWLNMIEDGKGELTLLFDAHASEETRFHFEEYVQVHLQRKALPASVQHRQVFTCGNCGGVLTDQLVRLRRERSFDWIACPVCETHIDLRDNSEQLRSVSPSRVTEMDKAADLQRSRATAQSTVQGKQEVNDFDVFLCYNKADRTSVMEIGKQLKEQLILPWLDEEQLRPGLPWQRLLEQQIGQIKSAAVFVGKEGIGPWQEHELAAFLRQFVKRGCPVIPVILSDAPHEPALPIFLQGMQWVAFRSQASAQDLDPLAQLIWGITGERRPLR